MTRKALVSAALALGGLTGAAVGAGVLSAGPMFARAPVARLPGGPAPKALVGRYRTRFTIEEFRRAPDPRFLPNENTTEELVILNASSGSSQAVGLHDLGEGSPSIPFGVKGDRIYLACLAESGLPRSRGYATYRWALRGKLLTVKKVKDTCGGSNQRNQPYILVTHVWRKVAGR
jgi:hypothetical protein